MTIAIEICQDNFIYCKTWTQNLDVKTSKKPKERAKNQKIQCLEIIEKKKTYDYIIETKIQGKDGLLLIMHAWQLKAAR